MIGWSLTEIEGAGLIIGWHTTGKIPVHIRLAIRQVLILVFALDDAVAKTGSCKIRINIAPQLSTVIIGNRPYCISISGSFLQILLPVIVSIDAIFCQHHCAKQANECYYSADATQNRQPYFA